MLKFKKNNMIDEIPLMFT